MLISQLPTSSYLYFFTSSLSSCSSLPPRHLIPLFFPLFPLPLSPVVPFLLHPPPLPSPPFLLLHQSPICSCSQVIFLRPFSLPSLPSLPFLIHSSYPPFTPGLSTHLSQFSSLTSLSSCTGVTACRCSWTLVTRYVRACVCARKLNPRCVDSRSIIP